MRVGAEPRERAGRVEDASARAGLGTGDDVTGEVAERGDLGHAVAVPAA